MRSVKKRAKAARGRVTGRLASVAPAALRRLSPTRLRPALARFAPVAGRIAGGAGLLAARVATLAYAIARTPARRPDPIRLRVPVPSRVLPKLLRKPVRILSRIDVRLSRHAGAKGAVLFLGATLAYGTVAGGHSAAVADWLTSVAGLEIDAVTMSGQTETSELDILDRLGIPTHASIVTFDAVAARERVEALPWIESASIRKLYPATVKIDVVERTPFALWQHGGQVSLIDEDGAVISDLVETRYANLPMVVGTGAAAVARPFLDLLAGFPELQSRVKAASFVSSRRWTLTLDNGITVLLPETDLEAALVQLVSLDQHDGLLSRALAAIDLRQPDRLVLRLTEEGLTQLQQVIRDRERAMSRRGANA